MGGHFRPGAIAKTISVGTQYAANWAWHAGPSQPNCTVFTALKHAPHLKHAIGCSPTQAEPTALEKKLLRKRQRREQSDAIAGEVGTHGLADIGDDEAADSKTASFKGKKRIRDAKPPTVSVDTSKGVKKKGPKTSKAPKGEAERGTIVDDVGVAVTGENGDGPVKQTAHNETVESGQADENQGQKRKARRKKKAQKAGATTEGDPGAETVTDLSPPASPRNIERVPAGEETINGARAEQGEESGPKKQRRGFGKARSTTSTSTTTSQHQDIGSFGTQGETSRDRPRKKTRSKQKNIRKDKRPMDQRPSHLRLGDPGYAGRGLSEETRKVLGLPQDDSIIAPAAGWGMPVKGKNKSGWVIDKRPDSALLAVEKTASDGDGGGVDTGVAVELSSKKGPGGSDFRKLSGKSKGKSVTGRQQQGAPRRDRAASGPPSNKSKYRNLM